MASSILITFEPYTFILIHFYNAFILIRFYNLYFLKRKQMQHIPDFAVSEYLL